MSEDEIIEIIEKLQCEYKEQQNDKKYNDYTVFKATEYSKGLQGLLDLYNKEKEKNKELEKIASDFIKRPIEQFSIGEFRAKVDLYNKGMPVAEKLIEYTDKKYISKDKIKEKIERKIAYCRAEELEDSYIGDKHSQYWGMYRELLEKLEQQLLGE